DNTTANRPTLGAADAGFTMLDTTLGQPIWWDGVAWVAENGLGPKGADLEGSDTWDPGSLADGAGETSSGITVTGAALGDFVLVSAPCDLQGITATAYVSAADTVTIRVQNETGGTIDLASGTWRVRVIRK